MTPSVESVSPLHFPQRAFAFLRIVVGLWFIKSLFTKVTIALAWGFLPVPAANARWTAVMPKLLTKYAANNPIGWYRDFQLHTVIPHAHLFASFTGVAEAAIGISLTIGLLTRVGSLLGAFEVISYGLTVQHLGFGERGFHVMLLAMMIAFLYTGPGRYFGADAWIRRHSPLSFWTKLG